MGLRGKLFMYASVYIRISQLPMERTGRRESLRVLERLLVLGLICSSK